MQGSIDEYKGLNSFRTVVSEVLSVVGNHVQYKLLKVYDNRLQWNKKIILFNE